MTVHLWQTSINALFDAGACVFYILYLVHAYAALNRQIIFTSYAVL